MNEKEAGYGLRDAKVNRAEREEEEEEEEEGENVHVWNPPTICE